jgi:hypothetical protein
MSTNPAPQSLLQYIRANKLRSPHLTYTLSLPYLLQKPSTSELYLSTVENLCIASLDINDVGTASECIAILAKLFPDSARVTRLKGLAHERSAEWGLATEVYNGMLNANDGCVYAHKRLYCVARQGGGDASDAIHHNVKQLLQVISMNQSDVTSWYELSDLYLSNSDYVGASYALEEIILFTPLSPSIHCKLAECYYTIGMSGSGSGSGGENRNEQNRNEHYLTMARRHFSEGLNLKKGYTRAAIGLLLCSKACYQLPGGSGGINKSCVGEKQKEGRNDDVDEKDVCRALFDYGCNVVRENVEGSGKWLEEERMEMV